MKIPDNLIPLVYIIATAGIAAGLYSIGVPEVVAGAIVGAGLTRAKKSVDAANA